MLFPSVGGYMLKNVISKRRRLYVKKHQRYNKKKMFPNIPMGAIKCSCPIRLDPTYILPAKEIRLLGKFQRIALKLRD